VLIVDDDAAYAISLELMLQKKEMTVFVANRIHEAWAILLAQKIDIILLDIHLSEPIDGIDLARELRQLNIPIVFITSDASDHTFVRAQHVQSVPFLTKPISQYTLLSVINTMLLSAAQPSKTAETATEGEKQILVGANFIFVKRKGKLVKLEFRSILYLMADGNYIRIFLENGASLPVNVPLKEVLSKFPESVFTQVHRKYVVNIDYVFSVAAGENEVKLTVDQIVLPISRTFKVSLLKAIEQRK
jgi:two-component system, LytTR family, response regulator